MSKKKRTTHFYSLLTIITYVSFDPYDESQNQKLEQESLVTFDCIVKTNKKDLALLAMGQHVFDLYPEIGSSPATWCIGDTWERTFYANGKKMLAQFSSPEPITKRAFLEQQYKKSLIPVP